MIRIELRIFDQIVRSADKFWLKMQNAETLKTIVCQTAPGKVAAWVVLIYVFRQNAEFS